MRWLPPAAAAITLPVLCSDSTEYIALYAGTDGSSRQEPGTAGLVTPDAYVFISGTVAGGVLTADAIARPQSVKTAVFRAGVTVCAGGGGAGGVVAAVVPCVSAR